MSDIKKPNEIFLPSDNPNNSELNRVINSIRQSTMNSSYNQVDDHSFDDPFVTKSNKVDLIVPEVTLDDKYIKLNSGDYQRKFESYIHGVDNEHRLAQQQSTWEKWGNGLLKMGGKTFVNVVGGTLGFINGVAKGVSEGSLTAAYNNDFSKWLDDLNTQMDYNLPNYYSQEERSLNFLQSMGTANFWANDVVGGALPFITGTIGSEALWAWATGGASLFVSIPKIGAKLAGKGILKAAGKTAVKQTVKKAADKTVQKSFMRYMMNLPKDLTKAYESTIPLSRNLKAFNNFRALTTSSTYEAAVEARHNLDQMIDSYNQSFQAEYGRLPNHREYGNFIDEAKTASNYVFGGNIPLVAAGNIASLGNTLGIGTSLSKNFYKVAGKKLGMNIVPKFSKKSGTFIFSKVQPTKIQKIVGQTGAYLKAPLTEGFIEEGGQGVLSKSAENYIAAKYNPDSYKENLSLVTEVLDAFKDTYGTKEGFKEVGIGMLIGGIGSRVDAVSKKGSISGILSNDYSLELARRNKLVDVLNEGSTNFQHSFLTDSQKKYLRNFNTLNSINKFSKDAEAQMEQGNEFEAAMMYNDAQFEYHKMLREAGMEDILVEQGEFLVDNLEDSDFESMGIAKEETENYKELLKNNIREQYGINKKAIDIAEAYGEVLSNKEKKILQKEGLSPEDMTSVIAYELSRGAKSYDNYVYWTDRLGELLQNGSGRYVRLYDNLSKKAKSRLKKKQSLQNRKVELESQIESLQNVVAKEKQTDYVTDKEGIKQNAKTKNKSLEKALADLEKVRLNLQSVEAELDDINFRGTNLFKVGKSFLGGIKAEAQDELVDEVELETALQEIEKIDDFIKNIEAEINAKDTTPKRKVELEEYLEQIQYAKAQAKLNAQSFSTMNENFRIRTDKRFAFNSFKGLTKVFGKLGKEITVEEENLIQDKSELEKFIENTPNLSEYDKFNLRANHRIILNIQNLRESVELSMKDLERTTNEVISNELMDKYRRGDIDGSIFYSTIVKSLVENGNDSKLTDYQKEIYKDTYHKGKIKQLVEDAKFEQGDSLEFGFKDSIDKRTIKLDRSKPFKEALQDLIDQIIRANRYLDKQLVDSFGKDNIPTKQDYERFEELVKLQDKDVSKLTPKKIAEIEKVLSEELPDLRKKINDWGVVMGTVIGNRINLADLIEIQVSLNEQEASVDVVETLIDLNELTNDVSWGQPNAKRNFDIGQVYDYGVVSKTENNFKIHNVSLDLIIDLFEKTGVPFTVKEGKNKRILEKNKHGVYADNNTKVKLHNRNNVRFVLLEFEVDGKKETIRLSKDLQNNVVFNQKHAKFFSNLKFMPVSTYSRNYQPLLIETEQGELLPVSSDYGFDNASFDIEALYKMKKGDLVHLEVDLAEAYNKKLIEAYQKAKGKVAKQKALKELESKLLIFGKNNTGDLIMVLKSGNTTVLKDDTKSNDMLELRKRVLNEILEEIDQRQDYEKNPILTSFALPISEVYMGFPNFNIQRKESGDYGVKYLDFNKKSLKLVKDIGFLKNGKIRTLNRTEVSDSMYPFMNNYLKNNKYKDKEIPFVVIEYKGRKVVYPITLKPTKVNVEQELDTLLKDYRGKELAEQINTLLLKYNVPINKYGVIPSTVNDAKTLNAIRQVLQKTKGYPLPSEWLTGNEKMDDILLEQGLINIDLTEEAFYSPKIKILIDNKSIVGKGVRQETSVEEQLEESLQEEVEETQEIPCNSKK